MIVIEDCYGGRVKRQIESERERERQIDREKEREREGEGVKLIDA